MHPLLIATLRVVLLLMLLRSPANLMTASAQTVPESTPDSEPPAPEEPSPAAVQPPSTTAPEDAVRVLESLQQEAERIDPLLGSRLARAFAAATVDLPAPDSRVVFRALERRFYYSESDGERQPPESVKRVDVGYERFYTTLYGSPLAYCRPLDLIGALGTASLQGKRVLDFGYGTIAHLRLMALQGADAVGVDVDSFLKALYCQPQDQGRILRQGELRGSVKLVDGSWPASVSAAVGERFDIVLSKNTLKRGYVHPEREIDPNRGVHLGVTDEQFVAQLYRVLNPGGVFLIYNLCPPPAPADQPYIPWADGRCPFPKSLFETTGFEVLAYDVDDSASARAMGRALGWGESQDLETQLFALYTLARKPTVTDK